MKDDLSLDDIKKCKGKNKLYYNREGLTVLSHMYQYVNERSMTVMILAHKMAAWGNTAAMVTEPAVKAYIRKKKAFTTWSSETELLPW